MNVQSRKEALLWQAMGDGKAGRLRGGHAGLSKDCVCVCLEEVAPLEGCGIHWGPAHGYPRAVGAQGAGAGALPGGAVAGRCPNCTAMQRSLSRGNL